MKFGVVDDIKHAYHVFCVQSTNVKIWHCLM
jgi:hypothetical protein